jgi:KUP system potassium uptake protein
MNGNSAGTPPALLHNLEHNKVLHERVILLTVKTMQVPYVEDEEERFQIEPLGNGFWRMLIFYGFMEDPDIPKVLEMLEVKGFAYNPNGTTFFLGRETIIATKNPGTYTLTTRFAFDQANASWRPLVEDAIAALEAPPRK